MHTARQDIGDKGDVKKLVDAFYAKVNQDPLLSPVFNDHAKIDWAHHLPTMYNFWSSLLLGTMSYKGQPFPKHLALPVGAAHFDRWLHLFTLTVDELFAGIKAEEVKLRARSIAQLFQHRMGIDISNPVQR